MNSIKVAAFTKGLNTPSARFRVRQLIPFLAENGISVHEYPALYSSYPRSKKYALPAMAAAALMARVPDVIKSYGCDVSLLQREMFSTLTTLEPLVKRPIVLDVDDAIFLRGKGRAACRLAGLADQIICGNEFLAEFFSKKNLNITIIPTAIDMDRYQPKEESDPDANKVIGWIGTKGNFKYLYEIMPALEEIVRRVPDVRIRVIADEAPSFSSTLMPHLDFVAWHPDTDVEQLQKMSIGIMPLSNGDWERGKCSFKMLQYMACGLPVIVSPVGMNQQVLEQGELGLAAATEQEWIDRLLMLINEPDMGIQMGKSGRDVVEEHYSLASVSSQVSAVIKKLA